MASLRRSDISFRRQGSSGIVWGEGSIPHKKNAARPPLSTHNSKYSAALMEEQRSSREFFHSRSTGSVETPMEYFHTRKSQDRDSNPASHKSRFRFGRWVKRVLSKPH
ncbi:hypothetical protein SUGI_0919690 [Cryptomeria japonica]|uniref:uncharacterized protein LOC131033003 n=1 Tax=Cryptomeria japonica TaxID=3369 RepID=UPI0024147693|nr:uncharacterized protein LOC131033003 [Cryptomeria japonica]GLJ44100.1 hypothetical protein SUGI_0919690 [Cryptomeria japonica]